MQSCDVEHSDIHKLEVQDFLANPPSNESVGKLLYISKQY